VYRTSPTWYGGSSVPVDVGRGAVRGFFSFLLTIDERIILLFGEVVMGKERDIQLERRI